MCLCSIVYLRTVSAERGHVMRTRVCSSRTVTEEEEEEAGVCCECVRLPTSAVSTTPSCGVCVCVCVWVGGWVGVGVGVGVGVCVCVCV